MADRLKPNTWQWKRRQHIHGHNSLLGGVAFSRSTMARVMMSHSTTQDAKQKAAEIRALLFELEDLLKERINDPEKPK